MKLISKLYCDCDLRGFDNHADQPLSSYQLSSYNNCERFVNLDNSSWLVIQGENALLMKDQLNKDCSPSLFKLQKLVM